MKLVERLKELKGTECLILSVPATDCMLTGVSDARISKDGQIKIVYQDGAEERAQASTAILDRSVDDQSLFQWVGHVQSTRDYVEDERR